MEQSSELIPQIIIFLLGTVIGSAATYYIRKILSKSRAELENYNFYISAIDETIKSMLKDALDFSNNVSNKKSAIKESSNRILSENVIVKSSRKNGDYLSFVESNRLVMIARQSHLKRLCQSVKIIRPKLFPIPTDKFINLNKAISFFYEEDHSIGLSVLINALNELFSHYQRQSEL